MKELLTKLRGGIIVSVQADEGEPLNSPEMLAALGLSALNGGAIALRMANPENIFYMKHLRPDVPVIGITKPRRIPENYRDLVYITPTREDIRSVVEEGNADIVAVDATSRLRLQGESLEALVMWTRKQFPNLLLMADVSTLDEGVLAAELGFDIISTTLSGYTASTKAENRHSPDFDLLRQLIRAVSIPVILEGRVWETEHVREGFRLGAFAIVIGSAITRPHEITRRFVQAAELNHV